MSDEDFSEKKEKKKSSKSKSKKALKEEEDVDEHEAGNGIINIKKDVDYEEI